MAKKGLKGKKKKVIRKKSKKVTKKKPARKTPARKKPVRGKTVKRKTKKKVVRKKIKRRPAKRKATKKKLTKKKKVTRKKIVQKNKRKPGKKSGKSSVKSTVTSRRSKPLGKSMPPMVAEERVGVVIHYYSHLSVAVVRLDHGALNVGDSIHIKGYTTDLQQRVESMEIERQPIQRAGLGQEFGMKVVGHVREHDLVYRMIS